MSNARQSSKLSSSYVVHEPVNLCCDDPSRTRGEFQDECDVNVIMRRFEQTGVVSHINPREPMYMDLSEGVPDLRTAIDTVRAATESFMSLPASVRATFDNDPVAFVEFARNPENVDKMVEWGLAERKPDPIPTVRVHQEASPPAPPPPDEKKP